MANLSKIMLPDGTTYDICDTTARKGERMWYGTCATGAGTQNKVVTTNSGDFVLEVGSMVRVKFTNAFTYNGTSRLNVDGTGNVDISRVGTTETTRYYVSAGEAIDFVYDGTDYLMARTGTATTTYYGLTKLTTSAYSTSTSTALTPASLNSFAQYVATGLPAYSASSTYERGDRVRYGNYMYECNTDIMTAEAWTAAHWTALDPLLEQIDGKSTVTINRKTTTGTNICDITIDGTTTQIYAPTGGGGTQVQSDWNENDSTSPSYILNKPTIPSAPVQSNWNESDSSSLAYIQNKPTGLSQFSNDANFCTLIDVDDSAANLVLMTPTGTNTVSVSEGITSVYYKVASLPDAVFVVPWSQTSGRIYQPVLFDITAGVIQLISYDYDNSEFSFITLNDNNDSSMTGYISTFTLPTATSDLTNDSGFISANDAYPVGSVYVTSTNSAPTVGGTWTLIDKEFTPTTATQISVGTGSSKDFVLNSTNTTSMSAWVSRHGHSITLSVNAITFKVAVSGTNLTLGTFNLSRLGASEATVSPIIMGWSDGAHAIVGMTINRTSGVLQSQDVVVRGTGTSIAAGSSAVFTVELPCDYQYMTDSLCNKFYWRRTA